MLYLYLDESGDLGFDFVQKRPSKFFVVSILAVQGMEDRRRINIGVKRTIKKINHKRKSTLISELKGTSTILINKQYCFKQIQNTEFTIYSLILNKRRVFESLTKSKERVYNYIARLLLDKVPVEKASSRVELIVDKSKSKPEIGEFNRYIITHLQSRLEPRVSLKVYHQDSQVIPGLQLADLFAWGTFRKYEAKDTEWHDIYKKHIQYEKLYLG